ncbi:hypothetical protein [Salinivirga sp.]|nr:hypothetical protein [Salinivirga sp.]
MRLAGKLFTADQQPDPRRVGQTKLLVNFPFFTGQAVRAKAIGGPGQE